ncbi:Na(+)/H(+) exchange regulatory cofactor NHE-RF3 [Aplochiton taeniatus]
MAGYKPRVIALTKRQGQTFGFFLRVEQGEEGHLIRCLEMGGPAELAGLKDGDRILRINKTYVDNMDHSEVVELVKESGATVTFHVLDKAAYNQAKAEGVDLADPQAKQTVNGVAGHSPKPKLCYLVKGSAGYGFSLRSVNGEQGVSMTDLSPGGVAEKAGVKLHDRVVEVNGENVENLSHDNIVEMIKAAGGNSILFLLVDEETDRHYKSQRMVLTAQHATVRHLQQKPRIADMKKGSDGYGYFLRVEPNMAGHFIKDIDGGSPAEKAGLKDMDRLVAVDGQDVDDCSHQQVVERIRQSGSKCCLLVVDAETDKLYKLGGVSPILFWEEMRGSVLPPSYPEALAAPPPVYVSTPADKQEEVELKPKLCKMDKSPAGYGFHLNGIQGVCGQYIKEVVKGGAADREGLEDGHFVIEVNGVNVEQSTHEEAVALIRNSGSSLVLLVADKATYEQLKARGTAIAARPPRASPVPKHQPAALEEVIEEAEREEPRQESPSVSSSSSSDEEIDERL